MFDLDGDGTVDKQEFAHVIENFLNTVTLKETGRMPAISVEGTYYVRAFPAVLMV